MTNLIIENKNYSYKQLRNVLKKNLVGGKLINPIIRNCTIYDIPNKLSIVVNVKIIRHWWWDLFHWFDKRKGFVFGFETEGGFLMNNYFIGKGKIGTLTIPKMKELYRKSK